MEVQERSIDLGQGTAKLVLLSNNGFSSTDRYGVIGPGSNLDPSFTQTTSLIRIIESSFTTYTSSGQPIVTKQYKGAEYEKWKPYNGSVIKVYNDDFTHVATATYTQDSIDPYKMHLSPALPFTPSAPTYHIQFEDYDDSSASINSLAKAQFDSWTPSSPILSASSQNIFVLQSGYASRYAVGMIIYVQSPDCTRYSPNLKITSVIGDVISVGQIQLGSPSSLGFTPQNGDLVQLGGFHDSVGSYKLV
jgi:hypothetical protein